MAELISVIIPAYNAEKYIERCLASLLHQTYTDLEIIVVNDGSSDATEQLVKKMAEQNAKIKLISQDNRGAAEARHAGIRAASGAYIAFVDSDDFIDKTMLHHLYNLIKSGDYQIACCKYQLAYPDGRLVVEPMESKISVYRFDEAIKNLYAEKLWSLCAKLFRRELFDSSKLLVEPLSVGEDLLMTYSLMKQCTGIIVSNKPLYYYFRHGNSIMSVGMNQQHITDSMRAYQLIAQDMDKNSKAYEYHIQNLLSNDFGFLKSIILRKTAEECFGEIKDEILQYRRFAFLKNGNPAINNNHRLGIILLSVCPALFQLAIKIKG